MRFSHILTAILCLILIASSAPGNDSTAQITILHWNDFHAQNLPWQTEIEGVEVKVGGAAYLAGMVDSLRQAMPGALVLDAGDAFTGTPISSLTRGGSQIRLLNQIRPDAFELGNHEFDYGKDTLLQCLAEANFPVLCCNLLDSATNHPVFQPCLVIERNAVKVGVIGVILPTLKSSVLPGNMTGFKVADPVRIVNRLLDSLETITDVQVALSHQGVEEDQQLAKECPRLDVIVGGHRHATLFEPLREGDTYILQAGNKGEYLGVFQALVDTVQNRLVKAEGRLLLVRSDSLLQPDEKVKTLVDSLEGIVSAALDTVVGTLTDPWIRNEAGESNVGDWTADAMIQMTGCQIAFVNSGGLRRDIPAGPVKARDLWEMHPFGNRLVSFTMTGSELRRAINFQVQHRRDVLQVGGLRYRAERDTGKILELTVGGRPVGKNRPYTIAASEYITGHADKYFGFSLNDRPITELGWTDRELALEAFSRQKTVISKKDGRIILE